MGLSFTLDAGPRQRSHSQVLVPWDSWPHFTVSDSRFPQLGRPGPRIYTPQEQGGPVIPPGTGPDAAEYRIFFCAYPSRTHLSRRNPSLCRLDIAKYWLDIFCYRNRTYFKICLAFNSITRGSRNCAVDIATGYGLDGRGVGVRVPV
jgi:hypothetical protein